MTKLYLEVRLSHCNYRSVIGAYKKFVKKGEEVPELVRRLFKVLFQPTMDLVEKAVRISFLDKSVNEWIRKKLESVCANKLDVSLSISDLSYKRTKADEIIRVAITYEYADVFASLERRLEQGRKLNGDIRLFVPIVLSAFHSEIPNVSKDRLIIKIVNDLTEQEYGVIEKMLKKYTGVDVTIRSIRARTVTADCMQ